MQGRDGQRKAEKGSARKSRAAQGREGKRSVARSIAALMRWIPHGRERRGAHWAPPLLTVKKANYCRSYILLPPIGSAVPLPTSVPPDSTWAAPRARPGCARD